MTRIFKGSISFRQVIIGVLILSMVALFCAFQGYPLVIPVLIFFFSIHLLLVGKADRKLFLDLGLLLTLTIFMAMGW
jgi:hypothetical protein